MWIVKRKKEPKKEKCNNNNTVHFFQDMTEQGRWE
jgi:hypothetical protein